MDKIRIHFIGEGGVEEEALFKLIDNYGCNDNIIFSHENCGGAGNIPYYYQNELPLGNYDIIYCLYDVDDKVNDEKSQYNIIRKKLLRVLGSEDLVDKISLCTNPNILLLLLLGYADVSELNELTTSKKKNTKIIGKYCHEIGRTKEYDGHKWQVDLILNGYLDGRASYGKILDSYNQVSTNYKKESIASNVIIVLKALKEGDIQYFNEIMNYLK
ncbi:MAG: hypothetical protein IJS58_08760 [Bacilli bacterium]|nr:hypothetical protein [Bacilli bacterium]